MNNSAAPEPDHANYQLLNLPKFDTESRHRINCFAEGTGVLIGGVIVAIGIHGLCTLPDRKSD